MFVSAHIMVGGTIGILSTLNSKKDWGKLACGGILSHAILDYIPHWDCYPVNLEGLGLNLLIGMLIIMLLIYYFAEKRWNVIGGAFFAVLPDFENILVYMGLMERYIFPFHWPILHGEIVLPWGIITQIFVILSCVVILRKNFAKRYHVFLPEFNKVF